MNDSLNALRTLIADHGDDLPLDQAAICIARHEDAACKPDAVLDDLDTLAKATGHAPGTAPGRVMGRINEVMFRRFDFQGDRVTYHAVDNSLIHQVLGRRRGMPITLCLVYAEIARRLDVHLDGVGFPGHFVLRPRHSNGQVFVDPFHNGRILQEDQLWALFEASYPDATISEDAWQQLLQPITNRAFCARIARNLKASHSMARDAEGLVRASELLLALGEGPENYRDIGLALAQLGRVAEATDALATYLAQAADADDAPNIAMRLSMLLTSSSPTG